MEGNVNKKKKEKKDMEEDRIKDTNGNLGQGKEDMEEYGHERIQKKKKRKNERMIEK